jgi:hypothetical protein
MLVVAVRHLVLLVAQAAQAVAVLAAIPLHPIQELLEQQIQVAVVEATTELQGLLGLAAQASSSFHTQAQPNYLVVALLPNQAVTSFTHSHLLAHLALCHL